MVHCVLRCFEDAARTVADGNAFSGGSVAEKYQKVFVHLLARVLGSEVAFLSMINDKVLFPNPFVSHHLGGWHRVQLHRCARTRLARDSGRLQFQRAGCI